MDLTPLVALAEEFAVLGADLHGDGDNEAALQRMIELAVKHVPGCRWASVTVLRRKRPETLAHTGPVALLADKLQYDLDEGPSLQTALESENQLLVNVTYEPRWPRYAAALLAETPIRSVLAFQLAARERAALNLFAAEPDGFDVASIAIGAIFAAHASTAIALYEAKQSALNLERALRSNREIGTAIGIVMVYYKVTEDDAFTLLRVASQNLHVKLRAIALEVVETGTLPNLPERPIKAVPAP